jgi:hypothetical protein
MPEPGPRVGIAGLGLIGGPWPWPCASPVSPRRVIGWDRDSRDRAERAAGFRRDRPRLRGSRSSCWRRRGCAGHRRTPREPRASCSGSCSRPGKPGQCSPWHYRRGQRQGPPACRGRGRRPGAGGALRARPSDRRFRALRPRRRRADLFRAPRDPHAPGRDGCKSAGARDSDVGSGGRLRRNPGPVDEHDAVLAATSHLPHVLAFALVDGIAQLRAQR